jgi:hypothetical protein
MKYLHSIAIVSALVWIAGCASAPTIAIVEPVGPAPASQTTALSQGSLQVYSARQKEPIDTSFTQWEWDYNLGRNSRIYGLAHTDYIILTQEGSTLQYVRNALNPTDPEPALVTLPPGHYKVEAEAEGHDGQTRKVVIPAVVEPGKTTVVHLSGNWQPRRHFADADVVRLPDGQIAGWLAAH